MEMKYERVKIIGRGTFGVAWLTKSKNSQRLYVVKEIRLGGMSEKDRNQAVNEVAILAGLRHANVVRYREARVDGSSLYIAMEYADGGDLSDVIQEKQKTSKHIAEGCVMDWFVQICFALQYIHSRRILHRDLKPQNIFMTANGMIKIGDFGIARMLKDTADHAHTAIGTPYYMSPEICKRKPYNQSSDMWAAGCVLYEMTSLVHPFEASDFSLLVTQITKGRYKAIPRHYGALLEDLISVLLRVDPHRRPTANQVLSIPGIQQYVMSYTSRCKNHDFISPVGGGKAEEKIEDSQRETGRRGNDLSSASVEARTSGGSSGITPPDCAGSHKLYSILHGDNAEVKPSLGNLVISSVHRDRSSSTSLNQNGPPASSSTEQGVDMSSKNDDSVTSFRRYSVASSLNQHNLPSRLSNNETPTRNVGNVSPSESFNSTSRRQTNESRRNSDISLTEKNGIKHGQQVVSDVYGGERNKDKLKTNNRTMQKSDRCNSHRESFANPTAVRESFCGKPPKVFDRKTSCLVANSKRRSFSLDSERRAEGKKTHLRADVRTHIEGLFNKACSDDVATRKASLKKCTYILEGRSTTRNQAIKKATHGVAVTKEIIHVGHDASEQSSETGGSLCSGWGDSEGFLYKTVIERKAREKKYRSYSANCHDNDPVFEPESKLASTSDVAMEVSKYLLRSRLVSVDTAREVRAKIELLRIYLEDKLGTEVTSACLNLIRSVSGTQVCDHEHGGLMQKLRGILDGQKMAYVPVVLHLHNLELSCDWLIE